MKPIIGIIPSFNYDAESPFKCINKIQVTYSDKLLKAGALPIILPVVDGKINIEELEICDGFLLPGGSVITKAAITAVCYAMRENKPILGICLGMQTIACYDYLYDEINGKSLEEIQRNFDPTCEKYFLRQITGHDNNNPFKLENISSSYHHITIEKGTLRNLFGESLEVISAHNFALDKTPKHFEIVAKAEEIIEAIESENALGVQFHPEIEDRYMPIFTDFTKKVLKKTKPHMFK